MKVGSKFIGTVLVRTFSDGDTGLVIIQDDDIEAMIKLTGEEATEVAEWILKMAGSK